MNTKLCLVLLISVVILNIGADSTLDPRCPLDEDTVSVVVLLPHESDCSKFYACEKGRLTELECPPGLLFNPALNVCDFPTNVQCGNQ